MLTSPLRYLSQHGSSCSILCKNRFPYCDWGTTWGIETSFNWLFAVQPWTSITLLKLVKVMHYMILYSLQKKHKQKSSSFLTIFPVPGRQRQKGQEFKVILSCGGQLRKTPSLTKSKDFSHGNKAQDAMLPLNPNSFVYIQNNLAWNISIKPFI